MPWPDEPNAEEVEAARPVIAQCAQLFDASGFTRAELCTLVALMVTFGGPIEGAIERTYEELNALEHTREFVRRLRL